jgi:hypothetical protein
VSKYFTCIPLKNAAGISFIWARVVLDSLSLAPLVAPHGQRALSVDVSLAGSGSCKLLQDRISCNDQRDNSAKVC